MLSHNPFFLDDINQYKRRLDFFGDYVRDTATYISRMTGDEYATVEQHIRSEMRPGGQFEVKDPRMLILRQDAHGDRQKAVTTLSTFLADAIENNDLIAPNFNTFYQPTVKKSFQPAFMNSNIQKRSKDKKLAKSYQMAGNVTLHVIHDKKQTNRKLTNNAVSGTYTIGSTPLVNPTAHAVLTTTCRTTSGYANANNEKLIAGNRHYWNPDIVINNIISIINHTDYTALNAVLIKYSLVCPTVEQTMACIRKGAWNYWRDENSYNEIQELVEKLLPIERAAFVYTGDLYHIRVCNPEFMREFIGELIEPHLGENLENATKEYQAIHPDFFVTAEQVFESEIRGIDFSKIKDDTDANLRKVVATALHIEEVIDKYRDFISVFFTTTNVPASLAYFPESVRCVAITSDTDSTIFTTQEWAYWYGNDNYNYPQADAVGGVICMFATQTITHILALMSANFGIQAEDLKIIAMKNEFKFHPFIPTDANKHYMAMMAIREGNVFKHPEVEIKGVHMKNANAPAEINRATHDAMVELMDKIKHGKKLELTSLLKEVADTERTIVASIKSGSPTYCRYSKVKELATYRLGALKSPYQYHLFWNEVFGPKYGTVAEPPYLMVKLKSENLNSINKINDWLDTLEDQALAERCRAYLKKTGKKALSTFYIPEEIVKSSGIPDEVLDAADWRGIVKNINKTYYMILSSLGFYIEDDKVARLAMDYY